MRLFLALALVALCAAFSTARRWDPDANYYCGIRPFPAEADDYPPLPKDSTFHHQTTFFRHGARSPTKSRVCFPKDKTEWNICSNAMHMQPAILTDRFSLEARLRAKSLGLHTTAAASYAFPTLPLPNSQAIPGTCALGHLSDRGFWQAYAQGRRLGRALRGYYNAQGRNLTLEDIDIRSTDVHRTRATGIALGVGVIDTAIADISPTDAPAAAAAAVARDRSTRYGTHASLTAAAAAAAGAGAVGDVVVNSVGPQVTYRDRTGDALTMATDQCKGGKEYIKSVYKQKSWTDYDAIEGNALRVLAHELTGGKSSDLEFLYDCVKTRLCHGLDVPDLYDDKVDARLAEYLDRYWSHAFYFNHTFASQVITGPLLGKIYLDFASRAAVAAGAFDGEEDESLSKGAPTVSLRAGHDFGPMMNLVAALRLFEQKELRWPPYTSTLTLDLFSGPEVHLADDVSESGLSKWLSTTGKGFYVRAVHDGKARAIGICPKQARDAARAALSSSADGSAVEACPLGSFMDALEVLMPAAGQCSDLYPGPLALAHYLRMRPLLPAGARSKLDAAHWVGRGDGEGEGAYAGKSERWERSNEEIWESKRLGE